mgnify:CR=1 FL=1
MINRYRLLLSIQEQYKLNWQGTHGIDHWLRVLDNGIKLQAAHLDANLEVIELFAILHDSRRLNEWTDDGHGRRGADFAATLRGEYFNLRDRDFDMLYYAIDRHSDGLIDGDITVRTCWDADRLDLGRVGIKPDAKYLCTDAGKLIANTGGYNGTKRYDSGR